MQTILLCGSSSRHNSNDSIVGFYTQQQKEIKSFDTTIQQQQH